MNPKVIGIVILIIGLGVGLYFVNSGGAARIGSILQRPDATSTPAVVTSGSSTIGGGITSPTTGTTSTNPVIAFLERLFAPSQGFNIPVVGGYGGSSPGGGGSGNGNSGGSGSGPTPPPGFSQAQLSPWYKAITFAGVSTGQITLTHNTGYNGTAATGTLDITGWEIKTNRGGEFIPQAVNLYDIIGANPLSDIILPLGSNDTVNLYSNTAPTSIRLNECIGYLNQTNQFNPGFGFYSCPSPDTSQIATFTGQCQNYIRSIAGSCQSPDFSQTFLEHDYQCYQFLQNKFDYQDCVSLHASDANFLSDEWRVWMGSSPLDSYHDNVELLDRNGLLVDYDSY